MIELQPVNSSNLAAMGYDSAAKVLAVVFQTGDGSDDVWHYQDVPQEVFDGLKQSAEAVSATERPFGSAEVLSVGKYFSRYIRDKFDATKIAGAAEEVEVLGQDETLDK